MKGVYYWNESETFCMKNATPPRNKKQAKAAAVEFVKAKIEKFMQEAF